MCERYFDVLYRVGVAHKRDGQAGFSNNSNVNYKIHWRTVYSLSQKK